MDKEQYRNQSTKILQYARQRNLKVFKDDVFANNEKDNNSKDLTATTHIKNRIITGGSGIQHSEYYIN